MQDVLADRLQLLVGRRALGIEAGLEVRDELRRDDRILGERVVAVLLGESRGDPLAVLPVRAQDAHLLPGEPTGDDEAVQRVGLGLTAPHGDDGGLHPRGTVLKVEHGSPRIQDAEVVDVHPAVAEQPGGHLLDHPQTQRLEDRHERRQIDLATGLVELHAREALPRGFVPQADDESFIPLLQLIELEDVVDDQVPVAVRLVVVGEALRVPIRQRFAALGTDTRYQRVTEIVVPGAGEPFDLLLELLVGDLGDLDTGIHVHGEEDPGVLRLPERQVVIDGGTMEPLLEEALQTLAKVRVETIPWKGHDDRDAPAVEIPTDEHADAAVTLQLEEPADQPTELTRRCLEQLVLGERLEQGRRGLVIVRAGDQVLCGEHLLELVVKERRLGGRLHVRLRREEADHPCLADDLAVGSHPADTDVVHASATVHGRVGVGLREDQQVAVLDASSQPGIEGVEQRGVGERRAAHVRQDAEPAAGNRADRAAVRRVIQLVLAVAQEDEVELQQPVQEVDGLANLLRRIAHGGLSSHLQHVMGAILHRFEVAHDEPDVAKDPLDPSSRSARVASETCRSSSKCMTDSRWEASRAEETRSRRPSSSLDVPMTG